MFNRIRIPSSRFLALAALAAGSLVPAAAGAQTESKTLAGDKIAIYNIAGRLRVEATTAAQVTVQITRGGRDAKDLKIESGDVRGWQALRILYPSDRIVYRDGERRFSGRTTLTVNDDGTFGDGNQNDRGFFHSGNRVQISNSGSGMEAFADLKVLVPKGQRVALHLAIGEATVSNVDGDISVDVQAARVTTEHTRGRLTLDTGSGGVSVTGAEGEVSLDVGSGGVTVSGVRGPSLRIDAGSGSVRGSDIDVRELVADVGSGGVRFERIKAPRVKLDAGSGGAELDLLADIDDVTIDTGSGGVTIRLPAAVGAEVEIETGSGGIDSDFPVQMNKWERNYLRGKIGDGKGRIRIESGSGNVRLVKA
jgi:lia operon protein LiaG